jgi:hypothetical protein
MFAILGKCLVADADLVSGFPGLWAEREPQPLYQADLKAYEKGLA